MLVAPDRRMSSPVMTWMAAGAVESFSPRRETEVTSMFSNCSRLIVARSAVEPRGGSAPETELQTRRPAPAHKPAPSQRRSCGRAGPKAGGCGLI